MAQQISRQEYRDAFVKYQNAGKPEKAAEIMRQFEAAYPTSKQTAQTDQQIDASNEGVDFDFGTMVSNIPSSTMKVATDTIDALTSPIDTAMAIGALAKSGVHNAAQSLNEFVGPEATLAMNRFGNAIGLDRRPETLEELQGYQIPGQEEGEAFAGALDDRYGSVDNAKTTLMEDPAGMLLDVASLATGAGAGLKAGLKNRGMNTEKVDSAIGASSDLAPFSGSIRAPVAAVEGLLGQPVSRYLYQSAMKPSTTFLPGERSRLLDAGLDLGATPTTRSVRKVEAKRDQLGQDIADVEQSINKPGVLIDTQRLFDKVGEVQSKYVPDSPNAKANMEKIDKVVDDMMDGLYYGGGRPDPARIAKVKRNIYNTVSYDKKNNPNNRQVDDVQEATLKAIAAAAREQLEMLDPRLAGMNAQYGTIKDVQRKIQNPAAARVGNRDLQGLGAPAKTGLGAAIAGVPGAVAGAVLAAIDSPMIKSNLAVGAKKAGGVLRNDTAKMLELAAGQGGRLEEEAYKLFDVDLNDIINGVLGEEEDK